MKQRKFRNSTIVISKCFYARANAQSTSLRILARALFGMSLSLISESVREELGRSSPKMCRGSTFVDSRLKRVGMTLFFLVAFSFSLSLHNIYAEEKGAPPAPKDSINLTECYDLALKRSETLAISKEEIERAEASFFRATSEVFGDVSFVASTTRQDAPNKGSSDSSDGSTFLARGKNREQICHHTATFSRI